MPVLRFRVDRLEALTGLPLGVLEDLLFRLKAETEEEEEYLSVELNPDRPDMYIGEGLARAVKGLLGEARGWKEPERVDSGVRIVSSAPSSRPYVAAAVVYNVNVDEVYLEELIQFQEKLHDTLGRRRRKAAIGFHDLSKLPSKTIEYVELPVDRVEFVPLGSNTRMQAGRVLEETEQGIKYGGISLQGSLHPFLVAGGEVIAMPPVINSEITRVEPGTRDLFIDVTGTDEATVYKVLDVIVGGLLERPGARLGIVWIQGPSGSREAPLYKPQRLELDPDWARSILGAGLGTADIVDALERMGHNAVLGDDKIIVDTPPYRVDILGPIDLVEDIAIAVGYEELGYERPLVRDPGRHRPETLLARALRDLAIGLGFTEVMQLSLTSPRLLDALGYTRRVEVANPVQYEYSVLRPSMIPSIVSVLAYNQHKRKPVKVFEIGVVVEPGDPPRDRVAMGMGILDVEVGYEDIQAAVYALLRSLGVEFEARPVEVPGLIPGRTAELVIEDKRLAVVGEVKPEVLEALGAEYPMAVAELDLEVLAEWSSRTSGQTTVSP